MTPIEIRFGGDQPPASVHNRAAVRFGAALAEMTGGAINFRLRENRPRSRYCSPFLALLLKAWPEGIATPVHGRAAVPGTVAAQRGFAAAEDSEVLTRLLDTDVELVDPDAGERAAFAGAVAPLVACQRDRLGSALVDLLR
jgi:hypothetical protein